jgi:pimeloyl-ACP methyl ester carboxylesterase
MNLATNEVGPREAPTLLFLHGLGVSSWMWTEQVEALQDRYHCLTVDLPGSGDSYQQPWISFADTAVHLAALIRERASGQRAHVVGLSLGSYTALRLLADHPDVVLSMIVSGVSVRPLSGIYRALTPLMAAVYGWDWLINLSAKMMQLPEEAAVLFRRDSKRLTPETIKRTYAEVMTFTLPEVLTTRTQPILAVAGDKEARPVLDSLPDFRRVPSAVAAIAPNAHHTWNAEHPALFADMIAAWVEGKALPSALEIRD